MNKLLLLNYTKPYTQIEQSCKRDTRKTNMLYCIFLYFYSFFLSRFLFCAPYSMFYERKCSTYQTIVCVCEWMFVCMLVLLAYLCTELRMDGIMAYENLHNSHIKHEYKQLYFNWNGKNALLFHNVFSVCTLRINGRKRITKLFEQKRYTIIALNKHIHTHTHIILHSSIRNS